MIGADIEGFLVNEAGKYISALEVIPGDKENPMKTTHGAIQADGVLGEFNIEPATSEEEFVANVTNVIGDMNEHIKSFGLVWVAKASAMIDPDQLMDFRAMQVGCMPDFNAWRKGQRNVLGFDIFPGRLRSAAGHIHISWDGYHPRKDRALGMKVIQQMDLHHALPGLFLDVDRERRQLYGKAGAFRPKMYGVEFRTSSNFWARDENLIAWTYRQAQTSLTLAQESEIPESQADMVQTAINTYDLDLAEQLIKTFDVEMP